MDISKYLKPKSPEKILEEFCNINNYDYYKMKIFIKSYKTDNRIVTIFISFFLWAFSMSAIIGAIKH